MVADAAAVAGPAVIAALVVVGPDDGDDDVGGLPGRREGGLLRFQVQAQVPRTPCLRQVARRQCAGEEKVLPTGTFSSLQIQIWHILYLKHIW